jgi:hypothetical protein
MWLTLLRVKIYVHENTHTNTHTHTHTHTNRNTRAYMFACVKWTAFAVPVCVCRRSKDIVICVCDDLCTSIRVLV